MCKCKNVYFGSYDNQVTLLDVPPHMVKYRSTGNGDSFSICVDKCLKDEIISLWDQGITTTGCCCGHNHGDKYPYIGVIDSDIDSMKILDYIVQPNLMPEHKDREDQFVPKSLGLNQYK